MLSTHSRLHGSESYRVPWLFDEESVIVLKQFARFVRPGWVRLAVTAESTRQVAAFRSADRKQVAVVVIHSDGVPGEIDVRVTGDGDYRLTGAYQTDRTHECAPVEWSGTMPAESVTTLLYKVP